MIASTRSNGVRRCCRATLGAIVLALGAAACGDPGGSTYPSIVGETGGSSGAGGSGGSGAVTGTGGGAGSGGASGSSDSGTADDGATSGGSSDGAVDPSTYAHAACSPNVAWAPLSRIDSIAADHFARLGGVSEDQLTVAFTSSTGDAYSADRTAIAEAFDAPLNINGAVQLAVDRIALSPTALSAIGAAADRHSFVGFQRNSRGETWGQTSSLEFTLLRNVLEGGAELSSPVLGGDKRTLFFVITSLGKATLYESHWDVTQRFWGMATSVVGADLDSPDLAHLRRPTGAAVDGRTLFFYDEGAKIERGAWRASSGAAFVFFADIGPIAEAVPTVQCDTLYYQQQDDTGVRLFFAE
jgi:hypothetical protein